MFNHQPLGCGRGQAVESICQFLWCIYSHYGWFQMTKGTPLAGKLPEVSTMGQQKPAPAHPWPLPAYCWYCSVSQAGTDQLPPDSQTRSQRTTPCPTAPRTQSLAPHHLHPSSPKRREADVSPILSAPNPSLHHCQGGQKGWAGPVLGWLWSLVKPSFPLADFVLREARPSQCLFLLPRNVISSNVFIKKKKKIPLQGNYLKALLGSTGILLENQCMYCRNTCQLFSREACILLDPSSPHKPSHRHPPLPHPATVHLTEPSLPLSLRRESHCQSAWFCVPIAGTWGQPQHLHTETTRHP